MDCGLLASFFFVFCVCWRTSCPLAFSFSFSLNFIPYVYMYMKIAGRTFFSESRSELSICFLSSASASFKLFSSIATVTDVEFQSSILISSFSKIFLLFLSGHLKHRVLVKVFVASFWWLLFFWHFCGIQSLEVVFCLFHMLPQSLLWNLSSSL